MLNTERICFDFRLVELPDGNQIIDMKLKTPIDSLEPGMQVEYARVDSKLAYMERMKRQAQREEEHKRRLARNPLYRLACLCGLV